MAVPVGPEKTVIEKHLKEWYDEYEKSSKKVEIG